MKTNVKFINCEHITSQEYRLNFTDNVSVDVDMNDYDDTAVLAEDIEYDINLAEDTISWRELVNALLALEECIKNPTLTYDIQFDDDNNTMNEGFALSLEEAKDYIKVNNGSNSGYFGSFKSGIVSICCNETSECVYEEEIRHSDDKEEGFDGYLIQ